MSPKLNDIDIIDGDEGLDSSFEDVLLAEFERELSVAAVTFPDREPSDNTTNGDR